MYVGWGRLRVYEWRPTPMSKKPYKRGIMYFSKDLWKKMREGDTRFSVFVSRFPRLRGGRVILIVNESPEVVVRAFYLIGRLLKEHREEVLNEGREVVDFLDKLLEAVLTGKFAIKALGTDVSGDYFSVTYDELRRIPNAFGMADEERASEYTRG